MEHARRTVMDCGIPASGETGKKERRRKAGIQASELRGRTQTVLKSLSGMEERRSGGAEAQQRRPRATFLGLVPPSRDLVLMGAGKQTRELLRG